MEMQEIDQQKAEAFAGRMIGTLNEGAIAIMTSIGHRTGLFDAMSGLPFSTSGEIAGAANLDERYVREWLGAMVVGGIVEHDPENGTYYLPPEHAAFLTRAASPDNIAVSAQFISVMGAVEDEIVEVFRRGGGVPYSAFPRFHEVMAEDSGQTVVAALFEHILPLVPGLTERLEEGIEVLDVGSGSGRALNLMARAFPSSHFTGYDISEEGVLRAITEAKEHGATNVRFEVKDASTLDENARYDLITTFDAVHDQAKPAAVLKGIARALKGRRRLPHAGHRGLQPRPQQHGSSPRTVPLHRLHHALHHGLPRPGRRRTRHHVGRREGHGDARGSRLRQRGGQTASPRHREHLLHSQEELVLSAASAISKRLMADS